MIYLIFNAGYAAPQGESLIRHDLCEEAIRLGRVLNALLASERELGEDAEALGLLALMILHHARRDARLSLEGDLMVLEDQDRSRWRRNEIAEGSAILDPANARRRRVSDRTAQPTIAVGVPQIKRAQR